MPKRGDQRASRLEEKGGHESHLEKFAQSTRDGKDIGPKRTIIGMKKFLSDDLVDEVLNHIRDKWTHCAAGPEAPGRHYRFNTLGDKKAHMKTNAGKAVESTEGDFVSEALIGIGNDMMTELTSVSTSTSGTTTKDRVLRRSSSSSSTPPSTLAKRTMTCRSTRMGTRCLTLTVKHPFSHANS